MEEKIFDLKTDHDGMITKIVSYFPLSENEKKQVLSSLGDDSFDNFSSIFSDTVSDEEWNKTKDQIIKKFNDELFDIDKV
ncbi:hypothetical protein [Nitrosopumilus sp. S4]